MAMIQPDGYAYYTSYDTRETEPVAFTIDDEGAWRFYRMGEGPLKLEFGDTIRVNHTLVPPIERPLFPEREGEEP